MDNKKTGYYFKRGWNEASFVFKKLSFKTKFSLFLYVLYSFFGKLFIFTRPIFVIADQNIGKMISETRNLEMSQAYNGCGNARRYFGLLSSYFIKDAALLIVAILGFMPLVIYKALYISFGNKDIITIFTVFGIALTVIAFLVLNIRYMGVGYAGAFLPEADSNDMLYVGKTQMKKNRGKAFAPTILETLIALVFVVGGFFLVATIFDNNYSFGTGILGFVVYLVIVFLFALVITKLSFAGKTSRYEIYKDAICLKKPVVIKEINGEEEAYSPLFKEDEKDLEALTLKQMNGKEDK